MVLAREQDSLQFAAGAFGAPPDPAFVDELADAFRSGTGLPYDRQGASGVHRGPSRRTTRARASTATSSRSSPSSAHARVSPTRG
jgi:hypothetical protein